MSAADPAAAVAAYLLDGEVGTMTSDRVFRPELPEGEIAQMPRPCVVIKRAGGYSLFGGSMIPLGDPRLDLLCYGSTWLEADSLADELVIALKALRQSIWADARLYWARISAGPMPFNDPEKNWPCSVVSAQVAHTAPSLA